MKTAKQTMSKKEFESEMERLDSKYRLIISHINMLQEQLLDTEQEIQDLLDKRLD